MITGKIKGGVTELVELLNDNNAKAWKIVYDEDKTGAATVFASEEGKSRQDEIDRMIRVLSRTEISRSYVIMVPDGKAVADRMNLLKYEFSNMQDNPATVSGIGISGPCSGYSKEDVERMVNDGIERALLKKELEDLKAERKEFEEERRQFDERSNGVVGYIIDRLGGAFEQRIRPTTKVAVAGIDGPDGTVQAFPDADNEPKPKPGQDDPTQSMSDDAKRLASALKQYAEFDPDYIDVLCKLISVATSGKPLSLMGGVVKLSYEQIKEQIMSM